MPAGENVLAVALAAGIPLPHSCRAGRCATCKARLVSGQVSYPDERLPPGIVASEVARGEVLLCQARPCSDLVVLVRRVETRRAAAEARILATELLSLASLRVRVRILGGGLAARPGNFLDASNSTGDHTRLTVTAVRDLELDLEVAADGSALYDWLARGANGDLLQLDGPFETPR